MKILFALLLLTPAVAMAKAHTHPPDYTTPPNYTYPDNHAYPYDHSYPDDSDYSYEYAGAPDICPNRCMEYPSRYNYDKGKYTCAAKSRMNDGWYGHVTRSLSSAKQSALNYCSEISGLPCRIIECHKL